MMRRRLRFIFPKTAPEPWPATPPPLGPLPSPMPGMSPSPFGGAHCDRKGAHWPQVWMAVVPPCYCYGPLNFTCSSSLPGGWQ